MLERLYKLDDPFLDSTWADIVESWLAVLALTSTMKSEMAQMVLKCMFSDRKVGQTVARSLGQAFFGQPALSYFNNFEFVDKFHRPS